MHLPPGPRGLWLSSSKPLASCLRVRVDRQYAHTVSKAHTVFPASSLNRVQQVCKETRLKQLVALSLNMLSGVGLGQVASCCTASPKKSS